MTTASVGFHCPECAKAGRQTVVSGAALFGARPLVTQILIGINVAVFVLSVALGDGIMGQRSESGLLVEGAVAGVLVAEFGEWWRIVTSGFMHFGLFHLAFNMYALWILGQDFERSVGRLRFILVYVTCLMGGSFGALLVTPNAFTAGASGAIFGLFGVAVLAARSVGRSVWDTGLGTVLLINFVLTFGVSSISVGGHVGGFVAGLVCGWLVYELPRRAKPPKYAVDAIITALGVACFVGALWAATTWQNPIF
ncbi:MAG: rhomboid family intramembrane serine protease [Acidimicrobiales bacterium]